MSGRLVYVTAPGTIFDTPVDVWAHTRPWLPDGDLFKVEVVRVTLQGSDVDWLGPSDPDLEDGVVLDYLRAHPELT